MKDKVLLCGVMFTILLLYSMEIRLYANGTREHTRTGCRHKPVRQVVVQMYGHALL